MQRYNRTNFVSARVVTNILAAMQAVILSGIPQYIEDRKGLRWLRVCLKMVEGQPTFEFYARNGQEVGDVILQASFDWHADDLTEFSQLLVKVYTMTELPTTPARPVEPKVSPEPAVRPPAGLLSWRMPCGVTVYGQMRRKWFRKRFYVTHDRHGNQLPQGEGYYLDQEAQLYGTFQGMTA
uniref:Prolyl 4-hydroxylase alpha subunit n=1 Tax=Salmonella phage Phylax-28 TaxID=3349226 RepID=A0AB74UQN5_9CAUD